jgi:transcriptional regulator with XRE-family HTH domain
MKLKVGHKLLAIREQRKLTQAEIADVLDVPTSTYARIERNETSVSLDKLTSFAEALQVPMHELLPETVSITNNSTNSGQGGVIFGNLYFYQGDTVATSHIAAENKVLKETLKQFEEKIKELEEKLIAALEK